MVQISARALILLDETIEKWTIEKWTIEKWTIGKKKDEGSHPRQSEAEKSSTTGTKIGPIIATQYISLWL